jgi:hypothetical protein
MKLSNPQIEARIESQWNLHDTCKSIKMDWLGLEQILRDILSSGMDNTEKVIASREAIAAWTGRG